MSHANETAQSTDRPGDPGGTDDVPGNGGVAHGRRDCYSTTTVRLGRLHMLVCPWMDDAGLG